MSILGCLWSLTWPTEKVNPSLGSTVISEQALQRWPTSSVLSSLWPSRFCLDLVQVSALLFKRLHVSVRAGITFVLLTLSVCFAPGLFSWHPFFMTLAVSWCFQNKSFTLKIKNKKPLYIPFSDLKRVINRFIHKKDASCENWLWAKCPTFTGSSSTGAQFQHVILGFGKLLYTNDIWRDKMEHYWVN